MCKVAKEGQETKEEMPWLQMKKKKKENQNQGKLKCLTRALSIPENHKEHQ